LRQSFAFALVLDVAFALLVVIPQGIYCPAVSGCILISRARFHGKRKAASKPKHKATLSDLLNEKD
jgi:hypothetical protein